MIDDGVVNDELSVGAKFFGDSILTRVALGLHLVEIDLKTRKNKLTI